MSAAGLAVGGIALAAAAALGLAATVQYSPALYATIRLAGGAYLIYLGLMSVHNARADVDSVKSVGQVRRVQSLDRIFLQGIVVELLNPKTILFFMAFIPQFVDDTAGSVVFQMLVLGALVPLTAVPSDIIVALSGGVIANKISAHRRVGVALHWLSATVLIGLGLRIFVDF